MALTLAGLLSLRETITKIYGTGKAAADGLGQLKDWLTMAPSAEDKKAIHAYVKLLDERRVFYVPMGAERSNRVVGSLIAVRNYTDTTKANITHPGLDVALGAILDDVRRFLDTWEDERFIRACDDRDEMNTPFFVALGELRGKIRGHLELIQMIEPKVKATNIIPPPRD